MEFEYPLLYSDGSHHQLVLNHQSWVEERAAVTLSVCLREIMV